MHTPTPPVLVLDLDLVTQLPTQVESVGCCALTGQSCVQDPGRPGRSGHDPQIYLLVLQGKKGHTGEGGLASQAGGGGGGGGGGGLGSVYDPHSGFPAGFIQGPPGPPGPAGRKVRHCGVCLDRPPVEVGIQRAG